MILSEKLMLNHMSGDFVDALNGYWQEAEKLEREIETLNHTITVRNQTINGLIELNEKLTKENTTLKKPIDFGQLEQDK